MQVEILADTVWPPLGQGERGQSKRITTFRLSFWRAILPQILTHRMFSRSTSSSRALGSDKLISCSAYIPHFTREQRGMQGAMDLTEAEQEAAETIWEDAFFQMQQATRQLESLGIHRQHRNRLLEPFATVSMLVTATEWDNFFALRMAPEAQPEIQALAVLMYTLMQESAPVVSPFHTPYYSVAKPTQETFQLSAACCARVSYAADLQTLDHSGLLRLAQRLLRDQHMSPFEHQAVAYPWLRENILRTIWRTRMDHAYNLQGWASQRYLLDRWWLDQVFQRGSDAERSVA